MTDETKVGKDVAFFTSRIGIFKVAVWVMNFIALIILATTQFWGVAGMGAVHAANFTFSFVAVTMLISIIIYSCKLYNLPLLSRLPWKLLEVVYAVICALLYFISMAICGWAANIVRGSAIHGTLAAPAVFAALLFVAFAVFGFFTLIADKIRSQPAASVNT